MRYEPLQTIPFQPLLVDLRTFEEVEDCPSESDLILDTPLPPLSPEDVADLTESLYSLTSDMSKHQYINIFCAKGKRSAVAVAILKQAGFTNVTDLGGVECYG